MVSFYDCKVIKLIFIMQINISQPQVIDGDKLKTYIESGEG